MRRDKVDLEPMKHQPGKRSNSSGNLLAKRLYRNNSLTKLVPISTSSIHGSLNTSLIPSVSLRKFNRYDNSQPSIEITQGKIHLRKSEELPWLTQQGPLMKKKPAHKKFEKIDSITQKSILPEELKADVSSIDISNISNDNPQKFKPNRKWLAKLKQGRESIDEKLTPEDFIQLIEEEGGLGNQFCYLQRGAHPYDLEIVEFANAKKGEYITISGRGVTYFNWQGSRFVTLQEWRKQAYLFTKLMNLQFFGKYKLHKNFSNWKKYSRKIAMRKTRDKLQSQLLVEDHFLREALLQARGLCCRLETDTNYCSFDDSIPPLPFNRFKAAQQAFLNDKFEKRINEVQEEIKCGIATYLGISMRQFKELNKISANKDGKWIPLLNGDEKNKPMPYTKEATLRVQQEKFKRFLKLIDILVVHSKINMMDYATLATAHKLQEQNQSYQEFIKAKTQSKRKDEGHFKGKQYIECQLQIEQFEEKAILRPSQDELTTLMEDIVNRSTIKLIKNHRRIMNDPDIIAILYEGAEENNKEPEPTNILKTILGAQEKQETMVYILNKTIKLSYSFLQQYSNTLSPLIVQFFRNRNQLSKIPNLSSQDFFNIKEWIDAWRKELHQLSKLNDDYQSAVFVLNFKSVKEELIHCTNQCITKIKEVVPKILEAALQAMNKELKESLRLMDVVPIGIEVYIEFQSNKAQITNKFDQIDERLGQIGQLIEILKDIGGSGQHVVVRSQKQRKQLGEMMKSLRAKIQQAEMHNKVHEMAAISEVRNMAPEVFTNLQTLYTHTKQPRQSTQQMVEKIEEWEQNYLKIQRQFAKIQYYQNFLGMQTLDQQSMCKFSEYFKTYKHIWIFKLKTQKYHQEFMAASWKNLSIDEVKLDLQRFLEQSEVIKKNISKFKSADSYQIEYTDESIVSFAVMDIKKKIKPILEAIECLRDPSLQERQQRMIRSQFDSKGKKKLAEFIAQGQGTVIDLLKEGVVDELDLLKKVVFKSKKQLELNSKMATVSRFWGQSMGHASKGLIDNFAQHYWTIAAEIDQKITVINCVREDPEVQQGEFKMRVQYEKNLLDSLRQLLSQWQKHHNYMSYFEPIFSNPYWKGTAQYKTYTYAESSWKKLIKQISKDFSLRKLATQEKKHFAILRENNNIFEELKHAVQSFLNAKRQAFPKLYFLSNEQLLHLLLQDKDYSSIDKHLSRIFPHLKSLELNQQRNCPLAVKNMANECLTLRSLPPKQVLQLQQGLRAIQERMKEAVRSSLLKCSNYYIQDDFKYKQWVNQNVLQVLLFIGNAQFTKLLEYDYLHAQGDDMNQLLSYQMTQIKELHTSIKDNVLNQAVSNFKHEVLLMQAGHNRDIVIRLMNLQVRDENCYDWQKEVRSYYNGGDIAITKYLTKAVDYGYEFVCATYSYAINTLSQRHSIELANTAGLHYLPVLVERGESVYHFCISNAKNYVSVSLQPRLSVCFIHNLLQGALASNSFLQIKESQHLREEIASLISNFIHEAKCLLDKRQYFNLPNGGKNAILPTFNVALRIDSTDNLQPLQEYLKINYRIISVAEISIGAYLNYVCNLLFFNDENEFANRIQKACEIVNKCCGYQAIGLQKIRSGVLGSITPYFNAFRDTLFNRILTELCNEICHQDELKYYQNILREIVYLQRQQQAVEKPKIDKEGKSIMSMVTRVFEKKQLCILVGPNYAGKKHLILETYKNSGIAPVQIYSTDLLTYPQLLGRFENDLWKQGILAKHLKNTSYSQQQWFVFEGNFGDVTKQLLKSIVQGSLLLENGELLYLSPNWKFLISTEILHQDIAINGFCEVIYSSTFASYDQQLQHFLETVIRPYFKTNIEGFSALMNLCLNNFQKILKFRVKGRFLKADHLLTNFKNIMETVICTCPEKNLQARDNQVGLEKMFLWCIYWTIFSTLSTDNAKKFENQLFEHIKIEIDRSLPLSLSKFEFDNPSGSLKRIQPQLVTIRKTPYQVSAELQAIYRFIDLHLSKNRHILLVGDGACGKSQFLTYLKENLGEQHHSFVTIKISKQMSRQKFQQLLYRKAKIGVNHSKQKYLSAINGKKLVLMLDDINLLDEAGTIGRLLRHILAQGFYYEHITLEKIYLNNVAIVAAQNSSFEFSLNYQLVRHFKPIYLPTLSIRDIANRYQNHIKSQFAANLCRNIASLHQFATIGRELQNVYQYKTISEPIRVLQTLRNYAGKENLVKIWEYVSVKEYINSFPPNQAETNKIVAQIKNYSNLTLKQAQQQRFPLEDHEQLLTNLTNAYAWIIMDPQYEDYYINLMIKMQLRKTMNLFTINEPLCPSFKLEVLEYLCKKSQVDLIHPYKIHEISAKSHAQAKLMVYISDQDIFFEEMVEFLLSESKENVMFLVDFSCTGKWEQYVGRYPSLLSSGSRYYKRKVQIKSILAHDDYKQIYQWCDLLSTKNIEISQYQQQELVKLQQKQHRKIICKCQTEQKKLQQLILNSQSIQQTADKMKDSMQERLYALENITKEEQNYRKQLLNLKNIYQHQETEAQKTNRDTKIQSIEQKLNQLMALKRSSQDQQRVRQDQYNNQEKILKTVEISIASVKKKYETLDLISKNGRSIATFFALLQYFYCKADKSKDIALQQLSKELPVDFPTLMELMFECCVKIEEKSLILWLLNDRSIIIEDDSQEFIQSIEKKQVKCHFIRDVKQLEDFTKFQADVAYIFVGELRSEINYLNDINNVPNDKYSRDKTRSKDEAREKDDRLVKQVKDDKPNYKKNLYFIFKDKEAEREAINLKETNESSDSGMPQSRNHSREEPMQTLRRADRKQTKLTSTIFPLLSLINPPKSTPLKQKVHINLNHQITVNLKYKELKEGQAFSKSDNQMQDFLTFTLADEQFHYGGKRIIKVTDRNNAEIPLVTLVCRKPLPQNQRQNIKKYEHCFKEEEQGLIQQLLEAADPFLTGIIKNEQKQLQKFTENKRAHEKIILDKLKDNSAKSLHELGTKDASFQTTLSESIKKFQEQIAQSKYKRQQPYIQYFEYALWLWNYVEKLSRIYSNFKIERKQYKELILKCITYDKTQQHEDLKESQNRVNTESSKYILLKKTISYVIICLNFKKAVFSLCLLSILQEIMKEETCSIYSELYEKLMNSSISNEDIRYTLNQKSCSKQLFDLLEKHVDNSDNYFQHCKAYIHSRLNINLELQYSAIKCQWIYLQESFVVFSAAGTNYYEQLINSKNTYFVKENSDWSKCAEIMQDRGLNKLVLMNFNKEESYNKILSLFQQWPQQISVNTIFLFTQPSYFQKCQFKRKLQGLRFVEIQDTKIPHQAITTAIERNLRDSAENDNLNKILRTILFNDIHNYIRERVQSPQMAFKMDNACFYDADFISNLISEIVVKDSEELLQIVAETIYQQKGKWILKQAKKYFKKQDCSDVCKVLLGESNTLGEQSQGYHFFMTSHRDDILKKLSYPFGCEEFAKSILTTQERLLLSRSVFNRWKIDQMPPSISEKQVSIEETHWQFLNSFTFESFNNLESIKFKRESDLLKNLIRKQNKRHYILYRWIENNITELRQINSKAIISTATRQHLHRLKAEQSLWGLHSSPTKCLLQLQKKIVLLQEAYLNNSSIKKINFDIWTNLFQIIYLHLYTSSKKIDFSKAQIVCKVPSEKDEKIQRGWIIPEIELKNCRYDQTKHCLEVNDRNQNKKINNIMIVLCEKEPIQGSIFSLPLTYNGNEYFKLDLGCKFKEEGGTSRQRMVGVVKGEWR